LSLFVVFTHWGIGYSAKATMAEADLPEQIRLDGRDQFFHRRFG
jgi:hypothetical protein